jgi:hypothetical protein
MIIIGWDYTNYKMKFGTKEKGEISFTNRMD